MNIEVQNALLFVHTWGFHKSALTNKLAAKWHGKANGQGIAETHTHTKQLQAFRRDTLFTSGQRHGSRLPGTVNTSAEHNLPALIMLPIPDFHDLIL